MSAEQILSLLLGWIIGNVAALATILVLERRRR